MADTKAPPARTRKRRHDSIAAEAAFRRRLDELGATLLEPEWLGTGKPHRARCAAGHDCNPIPSPLTRGVGICGTCAGNNPRVAEAAFRKSLTEAGATLLEPEWLGVDRPHLVRCVYGHESTPRPTVVRRGGKVCRVCSRKDPKAAEAAFRARLEELGATLLETKWLGVNKPHRVICSAGHPVTPRPGNVREGWGICKKCAGLDPENTEAAFLARLAQVGATSLEPRWTGTDRPHRVRCAAGHEAAPTPGNVHRGQGICQACSYTWDIFYVVRDPVRDIVKFGVTSQDARHRLATHARDGFTEVHLVRAEVTNGLALERVIAQNLTRSGEAPVRGREYFPGRTLGDVLKLSEIHLESRKDSEGQMPLW